MSVTGFNRRRRETEKQGKENELELLTVKELKDKCEELKLEDYKNLKKEELISLIEGVKHD